MRCAECGVPKVKKNHAKLCAECTVMMLAVHDVMKEMRDDGGE